MNYFRNGSSAQACMTGVASLLDIFGVSAEPVVLGRFEDDLRALEADFRAIAADFYTVLPAQVPADSEP